MFDDKDERAARVKAMGVAAGAALRLSGEATPAATDLGLPLRPSITRSQLGGSGPRLRGIASHDNVNVAWVTMAAPNADKRMAHLIKSANLHDELVEALEAALDDFTFREGADLEDVPDWVRAANAALFKARA